jgi:RNA polymerase sigma-70 factor (sigma-E family)
MFTMAVRAETAADKATLAELFAERYAELVRLAYVLTGDNELAEDLTQDAFVKAWPKLRDLRDQTKAPAYLRRTVVNLVRQRYRRVLVERKHQPQPQEPVPGVDPSEALDLAELVRTLPIRKRACIVLRYYADLSEEETAAVLGVSIGTVKSQTHKALRQLAELVEKP